MARKTLKHHNVLLLFVSLASLLLLACRFASEIPTADLRASFKSSHKSFTTSLTSDIVSIYDVVENLLNKAEVSKLMGISEHNVCLTVHFTCTSSHILDLTPLLLSNPVQKSSTSFASEPLFENQWQYMYNASGGFSSYPNQSVLKSSTDKQLKFQQHLHQDCISYDVPIIELNQNGSAFSSAYAAFPTVFTTRQTHSSYKLIINYIAQKLSHIIEWSYTVQSYFNQYAKWSLSLLVSNKQKSTHIASVWHFSSKNMSHLMLILLLGGQVETNPGPQASDYPCGVCQDEVDNDAQALLCDKCNFWCHISCVGLSENHYNLLMNTSDSFTWVCYRCGCPNFDSSLYGTRSIEISNPFSTLHDSIGDESMYADLPKTSTPTDTDPEQKFRAFPPPKNRKNKVRAMLINCNGLKGLDKQAAFRASVEHHDPDIIFGCESKISPEIATYSIFPQNYTIYRKDRDSNGGGVFLAVKDTLICADIPDLN